MSLSERPFGDLLIDEIPRLRRYALALTRDATRAADLVQDCLTRGLQKQHLWERGSDLRAWLFTIMHNQYVTDVRRSVREGISVANIGDSQPSGEDTAASLIVRDLRRALKKLPKEQQRAILLVGYHGMTQAAAAKQEGVRLGEFRLRVWHGRSVLRILMEGSAVQQHIDGRRKRAA